MATTTHHHRLRFLWITLSIILAHIAFSSADYGKFSLPVIGLRHISYMLDNIRWFRMIRGSISTFHCVCCFNPRAVIGRPSYLVPGAEAEATTTTVGI